MSFSPELKLVHKDDERVDLLQVLQWVFAENQVPPTFSIAVKAYETVQHGQVPQSREGYARIDHLSEDVVRLRAQVFTEVHWAAWAVALSGWVVDDHKKPVLFVPMLDLEITATGNPLTDLFSISNYLRVMGQSGVFLQSGDNGIGSYFFVGDKVGHFGDEFQRFMGLVLTLLIDWQDTSEEGNRNQLVCLSLGEALLRATGNEETRSVAVQIHQAFPSAKNGERRPGLRIDPRWVGYRFKDEPPYLRDTPAKGYNDRPLVVAELY